MYDFVPVCETTTGLCVKSKVGLCDLKPPQFPAWFSADKKSLLMQTCPSWKAYQENCKGGPDSPPWWLAVVVLTFIVLLGLAVFILYKKKRLKWASRVSDVSLQAKQICCSQAVETSKGVIKKDGPHSCPRAGIVEKTVDNRDVVSGTALEKVVQNGEPCEPYYYVLEDPNSVVLTKTTPALGTFGQRVISPCPPPPPSHRLPPLGTVNNNGVNVGKPAVLLYPSGKIQVCEQKWATGRKKRQIKCKKGKQSGNGSSSAPHIEDKYTYGD